MADQRVALSAMLSQLLEEKEKRHIELKKRLVGMVMLLFEIFTRAHYASSTLVLNCISENEEYMQCILINEC